MDPAELAARGWTRETKIRRDRHGRWFEDGVPIDHAGITRGFNSWIGRAPDGRYCLKNSIHWVYVDIEGPPIFVRHAQVDDAGVMLTLSDGRLERLDPDTLRQGADGAVYCDVRGGALAARFDSSAAMQLADSISEDDGAVLVTLGQRVVRPPVVDDPLVALAPKDGRPHGA